MPVKKDPNSNKWCFGENCNFKTKKDAEAAERAYHANMEKSLKVTNTDLAKSFDEDKRVFTSIVLKANYRDNDGENEDYWDESVVEQAAYDYMIHCQKGNIQHLMNTSLIKVVESYIAPVDFELGEGKVGKGDWVLSIKVYDDELWKMCKDGIFKGFSIGCKAIVEEEDEE